MMDEIIISGLKIFAWHGVYEEEQEKGQNFVINAKLFLDTSASGDSDSLDDTVDYGKVCLFINDFMRVSRYNTLEALVNNLARKIMIKFPWLMVLYHNMMGRYYRLVGMDISIPGLNVDAVTPLERQEELLDLVTTICESEGRKFETFEQVVDYYKKLINICKQMNYSEYKSEQYYDYKKQVEAYL